MARTLDMAGGRAFLLPVVVDGTSDTEALVPEKFREVQWTRLPPGASLDAFVERVRRLVSPEALVTAPRSAPPAPPQPKASSSAASAAAPTGATMPKARSRVPCLVAA